MKKLRFAALMLSVLCAVCSLSSCDGIVDSILADLSAERTADNSDRPTSIFPEETTHIPETTEEEHYVTVIVTETDEIPVLEGVVETAKPPETTAVPPETTAEPAVTEPPVPEEFKDHVYLVSKNNGNCRELVGDVKVHVYYVNDTVSSWNYEDLSAFEASLEQQAEILEADARKYGKSLDLTFTYTVVEIPVLADTSDTEDDWQEAAVAVLGLTNLANAQKKLNAQYGGDSNPMVFAVNKAGRAYASWSSGSRSERVTLFSSKSSAFRHELCHLYGARDFYYPEEVVTLSDKYLNGSLMGNGDEVDALSAYLIGWDDELDANAYAFLDETKHLTLEYLREEQSKQNITGNVTDYQISSGIYTGYLERGIPNGVGRLIYNSGDIYEGDFVNGNRHGTGKYTWQSGNCYEGDWQNGERTGKGTYTWTSGDKYIGDFVKGVRTGYGKYIWQNGDVYEGDFVDNVRTGQGTVYYAGGGVYTGGWLDGKRHGEGTYKYTSGSVYVGSWKNGERSGYGRMDWNDGSSYEGEWVANKRQGYGKYVNQYGMAYEGQWENDFLQN